jgi:hypothetical protein
VNLTPSQFDVQALEWGISFSERIELQEICQGQNLPFAPGAAETWSTFDFRNEVSENLISASLKNKGLRYRDCHRKGMVVECKGPDKHKFVIPYCCDLRFCPFCAPRSFMRLTKKHSTALEYIRVHPRSDFRLREITLTSLNTGTITKQQVDNFNASVKKTLKTIMKGIEGWGALSVDELGFNNTNLHAHILYYGPFIRQAKLVEVWKQVSGFEVAWIELAEADGPRALLHLLKYVSKPPSNNPALLAQLEVAFHRARRVFAYKMFYNFKTEAEKKDEEKATRACPTCGAELVVNRELRPLSVLRAEGLPMLESIRQERTKDKWIN